MQINFIKSKSIIHGNSNLDSSKMPSIGEPAKTFSMYRGPHPKGFIMEDVIFLIFGG